MGCARTLTQQVLLLIVTYLLSPVPAMGHCKSKQIKLKVVACILSIQFDLIIALAFVAYFLVSGCNANAGTAP